MNMITDKINEVFIENGIYFGRMISGSKSAPKGQFCVWNANAVVKSAGKIWFGDLNLTKDSKALNEIAKMIGEPIYILREMDARFKTEKDDVKILISKAVWTTNTPIPTR